MKNNPTTGQNQPMTTAQLCDMVGKRLGRRATINDVYELYVKLNIPQL